MLTTLPTLFGFLPVKIATWLTPVWILGAGALLGLVILLVLWGLLVILSPVSPRIRDLASSVPLAVSEGVLAPVFFVIVVLAIFGVVGFFMVQQPRDILASLPRLPITGATGTRVIQQPIPAIDLASAAESGATAIDTSFSNKEVRSITVESDQPLLVGHKESLTFGEMSTMEVASGETYRWTRSKGTNSIFPGDKVDKLYVANVGGEEAAMRLEIVTAPEHPECATILITAIAIVGFFSFYLLQRAFFPKIAAVALATAKSEMAQPLFIITMIILLFSVWLFMFLPYNTFGEDIKMMKNGTLEWTMVWCIILAVWASSTAVADEIEGRTAVTVLSKPISRRQFVLGKFFGIVWCLSLMFVIVGVWMMIHIAYKPIYDAREGADVAPEWSLCHTEMVKTVPGLALAFMETIVMAAISVAISTRLPMLANFSICFTIYALGHLTPLIVQSSFNKFAPVTFVGTLIATVLPVLDHFNIQAAIAGGKDVPLTYLATAFTYCVIYSSVAMLFALALFEDRDVA